MLKVRPLESARGRIITTETFLARMASLLVGCTPARSEQEVN